MPHDDAKALRIGRLLHVAVLEPQRWESRFVRDPGTPERPDLSHLGSPSSKAYRAELKAWRESVERERASLVRGREVVDADEWDLVLRMTEALALDGKASALLSRCTMFERAFVWRDAETGVLCRARVDAACDGYVLDLKSFGLVPAVEPWVREVVRHWYHAQAAFYLDGWRAVTGIELPWWWLVVGKQVHRHRVAAYQPDHEFIELGRREYRAALREYADRRRTGEWRADWQQRPMIVSAPGWAYRNSNAWSMDNG
jgi:exodeoxyribonuclease VIII